MKRNIAWLVWILALTLASPLAPGLAQDATEVVITEVIGPRSDTGPNVSAFLSVVADDGEAIAGLSADRFTVSEDGQEIDSAAIQVAEQEVGLAVVFVLDVSESMDYRGVVENNRLQDAKSLIYHFASAEQVRLKDVDLSGLVMIYNDPKDRQQTKSALSGDHVGNLYNPLANFERDTRAESLTPLKEGVEQAIKLLTNPTDPDAAARVLRMRRAIVILSDGLDLKSKQAETEDLIKKAQAAGINFYTIGIDSPATQFFDDEALQRLAYQTEGAFVHHNSQETHAEALELFDRLLTQRNLYRITYPSRAAKGSDHRVQVKVATGLSAVLAEAEADFGSALEAPQIEISSVSAERVEWREGVVTALPVTVTAQLSFPDDILRPPRDIQLLIDSVAWQPMTPTVEGSATFVATFDAFGLTDGQHAINVAFEDSVLAYQGASSPVNLLVSALPAYTPTPTPTPAPTPTTPPTPTPTPRPLPEAVVQEAKTNWWIVVGLCGLGLLLIVLFILLLLRTRNVRQVIQRTSGRLKRPTMQLGPRGSTHARLVVLSGYSKGREFRIPSNQRVVTVGRDPEFCDFPLGDPYISNPHFEITFETMDAFVSDKGSTNGTRVNGVPLQSGQRVLLQRDAVVEAGGVQVQFKRIGGTTRVLTPES